MAYDGLGVRGRYQEQFMPQPQSLSASSSQASATDFASEALEKHRGHWLAFTPDGSGTVIRWTYEFKPLRRRYWLVRHLLAPLWRHYMQAGVEAAARVAEDGQARQPVSGGRQ